jgi:hypothetical protein
MRDADRKVAECRRWTFLVPLVGVNSFLFLCFVGLFVLSLNHGRGPQFVMCDVEPSARIVKAYIASKMPSSDYRIRAFFPAQPLEGHLTDIAHAGWEPIREKGVAQRVRIDFYAPKKAERLDVVYWIQDGKVTKCMGSDHFRAEDSPGRR